MRRWMWLLLAAGCVGWLFFVRPFARLPWAALDAFALAWGALLLWTATLHSRVQGGWTLLAVLLLGLASVAVHDLRIMIVVLVGLACLPGWSTAERLGLGAIGAALGWWGWSAGAWFWTSEQLGAFVLPWQIGLLVLGATLILRLLPFQPARPRVPHPLLAVISFVPLVRIYQTGPVAWPWALTTLLVGSVGAGWLLLAALRASDDQRRCALAQAWWSLALAPLLLATEAGLAAGWTLSIGAAIATAAAAEQAKGLTLFASAGPFPPLAGFWGLWLAGGAALAGGVPLFLALWWITALLLCGVALQVRSGVAVPTLGVLALLAGLALPLLLHRVVEPMLQGLGAGLTPYGRAVPLPWIGVQVRDAGAVTATTAPGLVIGTLFVLAAAVAWLGLRFVRPAAIEAQSGAIKDATLWKIVLRRMPWARRSEGDHDS